MSTPNSPWRKWSAEEINQQDQPPRFNGEEENLVFSFSPSSSHRFLTPHGSSSDRCLLPKTNATKDSAQQVVFYFCSGEFRNRL